MLVVREVFVTEIDFRLKLEFRYLKLRSEDQLTEIEIPISDTFLAI